MNNHKEIFWNTFNYDTQELLIMQGLLIMVTHEIINLYQLLYNNFFLIGFLVEGCIQLKNRSTK